MVYKRLSFVPYIAFLVSAQRCVQSVPFVSKTVTSPSYWPRGGASEYPEGSSDTPRYDDERRRQRPKKKKKSAFQSIAETSLKLTTKTALATAKQSGKAAYFLVKPKHVDREELIGLWRLDQQILPNEQDAVPMECSANIELTDRSVLVTVYDKETDETATLKSPWKFQPAQWPRAAKVEFAAKAFLMDSSHQQQQVFLYKGQIDRKLAARSVIKIRGKIYRIERTGWRGKTLKHVPVGTFVARRRLKVEDEESDFEEDEDIWESDSEAGDDWEDDSEAGEVASDGMLDEFDDVEIDDWDSEEESYQ